MKMPSELMTQVELFMDSILYALVIALLEAETKALPFLLLSDFTVKS
jgi:hypothetical protein